MFRRPYLARTRPRGDNSTTGGFSGTWRIFCITRIDGKRLPGRAGAALTANFRPKCLQNGQIGPGLVQRGSIWQKWRFFFAFYYFLLYFFLFFIFISFLLFFVDF